MAILNQIRQKTVVLIAVIALALFAFILSGLFDNKDALFNKSPNVVATINGKDISREAFMAQVEARNNPNATQSQIMNQVYDAEVRKIVMESQFEKLGLTVGKEQMRELMKNAYANSPQFLNADGVYDESLLNQYIANLKKASPDYYNRWIQQENGFASSALQQNYINMIKAASNATLAEGELEHKLEGDKVDIKYVMIPYTSIVDSTVSVSKSEISSYISKNKKKYEVEASRNLQYVKFENKASVEDEATAKAQLTALVNGGEVYNETTKLTEKTAGFSSLNEADAIALVNAETDAVVKYQDRYVSASTFPKDVKEKLENLNVGEVFGPYKDNGTFKITKLLAKRQLPDSAKTRHILIPFVGAASVKPDVTQTETQAKTLADSLLSVLKRNKSKFPEFVKSYSSDLGSVEKGGKYDWFAYNRMVPEFRDFAFEKKVGDLGVVKSAYGFHIIEVEGQKNNVPVFKLATIERKIEPSIETEDAVFREASNFLVSLDKQDFQDAAKASNLTVSPVNTIKELDENIPGVGALRKLVRWSFEDKAKVGDAMRFETPNGHIVAQITAKNEAGLMNIEDASITALPEIRKEKKAKLIIDRIKETNLADLADAEKQSVRTANAVNLKNPTIAGAGLEPMVVGTAFGLEEGKTSKLIQGNKGVFKIEVIKKTPAVKLDNYKSFANQVATQKSNAINSRLYNALKASAEIEDNRAKTVQ